MVPAFHFFFTRLCGTILDPIDRLSPFLGILLLSAATSLAVLLGYSLISSPEKIKGAKNRIKAHILAIRLYRDFWKVIIVSFFKSLYYTGKYFVLNLFPLLLVLPLMFLLFVQMDIRYGMRPFRADEDITVKAGFNGDIGAVNAEIQPNAHFRALMNPVYIKALKEIDWKLKAGVAGATKIAIRVDGTTVSKDLVIGVNILALSNKKMTASSLEHFIYPAEKLLPPTSLKYIHIEYPARRIGFLGLRTHWLVYYFALTMIIALALKNRFGVEF
jgi:hypothetical protein